MIERLERLGSSRSPGALNLALIRNDAFWRDESSTIEMKV
jgi:hypothetical protein